MFSEQAPGNLEPMDSVVRSAAHFALSVCVVGQIAPCAGQMLILPSSGTNFIAGGGGVC